jgi:hypothetical protein
MAVTPVRLAPFPPVEQSPEGREREAGTVSAKKMADCPAACDVW